MGLPVSNYYQPSKQVGFQRRRSTSHTGTADTQGTDVKKLYHIIRTPTWIPPPWRQAQAQAGGGQMLKEITVDEEEHFPPEQIQRFKDDEDFYRRFVKGIEKDTSGNFRMVSSPRAARCFMAPGKQAHIL